MSADAFEAHFTRIANQLFRDARLSFKAKGNIGLVSTHKDGYGLSMESIAASSTDGTSAVRTGLKELERFGYLARERDRNEAGQLGQTRYWITDTALERASVSHTDGRGHRPRSSRQASRACWGRLFAGPGRGQGGQFGFQVVECLARCCDAFVQASGVGGGGLFLWWPG